MVACSNYKVEYKALAYGIASRAILIASLVSINLNADLTKNLMCHAHVNHIPSLHCICDLVTTELIDVMWSIKQSHFHVSHLCSLK